jgi:L-alanine-DL-glutamate epimerase-like enolase superfamily enzyme
MPDLTITQIEALTCSVPLQNGVSQGLGRAVRRDAVLVKVTVAGGLTGYSGITGGAGLPICTHGSHTGLNLAASVHFLASIGDAGYFEGDGSTDNPLRTELCSSSCELGPDGAVRPLTGAGLGVPWMRSSSRPTRWPTGQPGTRATDAKEPNL